jgi:BirA family biotin operon repressor/biotin-[acetyl-CoA-carboxylase] ligase
MSSSMGHRAGPGREPLREAAVLARLPGRDGLWRSVRVLPETGSTNADLLAEAARGAAEGTVLATESQSAGRGRMGRRWVDTPRAALLFSVLLRPASVPPAARGWLPLLTGLAISETIRAAYHLTVELKWPNDVLAGDRKLAGVLAEQAGDAVVLGAGINVSAGRDELPEGATSLVLEGVSVTDRNALLADVLAALGARYREWTAAGGDAVASGLAAAYQRACGTLGRQVRAELPGGRVLTGLATGIGAAGQLVLRTGDGMQGISAGDVIHLR